MNFEGIILGLAAFACIGLFHPIVIKAEYYFGTRCWWIFALVGTLAAVGSLFVDTTYLSAMLGVFAFSCYWSILEIFEQKKRVEKGWFPRNPKRKYTSVSYDASGKRNKRNKRGCPIQATSFVIWYILQCIVKNIRHAFAWRCGDNGLHKVP